MYFSEQYVYLDPENRKNSDSHCKYAGCYIEDLGLSVPFQAGDLAQKHLGSCFRCSLLSYMFSIPIPLSSPATAYFEHE